MAKKPLRRPALPPGRRLDLFLFLQNLVLRKGDQPVAELARAVGVSHQTIYKALTGPRVPSRTVMSDLATYLGRPDQPEVVDHVLDLWMNAVAEERSISTREPSPSPDVRRPESEAREELGRFWNQLRTQAGNPSLREMEARAGVPRTTLDSWFKHRLVPRNTTKMRDLLQALNATNEQIEQGLRIRDRADTSQYFRTKAELSYATVVIARAAAAAGGAGESAFNLDQKKLGLGGSGPESPNVAIDLSTISNVPVPAGDKIRNDVIFKATLPKQQVTLWVRAAVVSAAGELLPEDSGSLEQALKQIRDELKKGLPGQELEVSTQPLTVTMTPDVKAAIARTPEALEDVNLI